MILQITITIPLQRDNVCRGKNKPFFDGVLQRPVAVGQGESEKGGGSLTSRLQAACSLPGTVSITVACQRTRGLDG